jgi:hypothetical protein
MPIFWAPSASGASIGPTGTSGSAGGAGGAAPNQPATPAASVSGGQPGGCGQLTATDQGVTDKEIHLGIALVNLAGAAGNGVFGVPPVEQQQADFQAVVDDINKNGGIQCRKVVPTYYQGNPLDQNQEHSTCLQIVQDKVFSLLDVSAIDSPPAARDCVPQAKIPLFDVVPILQSEAQKQYYPYEFTYFGDYDMIMRDLVFGAQQLHWFDGAQKIGILEEDCAPEMNTQLEGYLAKAGINVPISRFNFGCPGTLIPPNQMQQAALQFKTAGVTHVLDAVASGAENNFSKAAQQQDYHPKYALPDGGEVATYQSAAFAPDPTNFNGALAITSTQYGGDHTPGVTLSEGTKRCDTIMAASGQPSVEQQSVAFAGVACNVTWMWALAASNAPALTRDNLVTGLGKGGSLDVSFPIGPGKFDQPRTTTAGQFWRPVVYDGACPCFRVADPNWHPTFPA